MNKELLELIRTEVESSFELEEINSMSFDKFFNEVDVQNAYEEGWKPTKYKPYYKKIYLQIREGKLA